MTPSINRFLALSTILLALSPHAVQSAEKHASGDSKKHPHRHIQTAAPAKPTKAKAKASKQAETKRHVSALAQAPAKPRPSAPKPTAPKEPAIAQAEATGEPAAAPPPPKPEPRRAAQKPARDLPPASEADYLAEMEAWRAYQTHTARAWKDYQARIITREAYDAEVKRGWMAYEAVSRDSAATAAASGGKENALGNLRLWMQLEFCDTDQAGAAIHRHFGLSGPTDDSPAFAGLLNRFVLTASPEAHQRIEREVTEFRRQSTDDIETRVQRIQANLGTRDFRKAYLGSWCGKT